MIKLVLKETVWQLKICKICLDVEFLQSLVITIGVHYYLLIIVVYIWLKYCLYFKKCEPITDILVFNKWIF